MKDPKLEAEKAEVWQAVKALLIPLSLFLACVISAGGVFLVYNREPLGWVFLLVAGTIIVLDFIGLIRFQNSYRAKGIIVTDLVDAEDQGTGLEEGSDNLAQNSVAQNSVAQNSVKVEPVSR